MTQPADGHRTSGLVEEALFDKAGALFSRDLDVARGEQEDLVGYPLHSTFERVGDGEGPIEDANRLLAQRAIGENEHLASGYRRLHAESRLFEGDAWEVGRNIHPHPTLSEVIGEAGLAVDGAALNI